ncbi:MAG: FAD/NAD(P)-binding oxidoreductase [Planctomycetota bacterium]
MSVPDDHCVIVGGGHAAAQLCASLRQAKWRGPITLIADEPVVPYHRPPLSKTQLDPNGDSDLQLIRPTDFYEDQGIQLRLDQRAEAIDRDAKTVQVGDASIEYTSLVLATGSKHLRPPISGIDHDLVSSLRTAAEAEAVRDATRDADRVAIIGAGFIGLEVAASLRKLGRSVTVFEMADRVLSRVTCEAVSDFFEALHRGHDVDLRTGTAVASIDPSSGGLALRDKAGETLCEVDFVVVGAGAAPNDDLARACGLDVDNGIVVDEMNRTSDPSIYAMGDCCNQFHPLYETRLRLESVQNATDQAKRVAAAIAGATQLKTTLPWFWSDQYDVKLQIAGVSTGYDRCVVRGKAEPGQSFSAWYLRDETLIAVDAINEAKSYVIGSKLIPKQIKPPAESLADVSFELKDLLKSSN